MPFCILLCSYERTPQREIPNLYPMIVRPKILALSYLFPNRCRPTDGIFVFNRLKALQSYADFVVVSPRPKFPFMKFFNQFSYLAELPNVEDYNGLKVYRPSFLIIPRYLKMLDSISYLACTWNMLKTIASNFPFDLVDVHWVYPDALTGMMLARRLGKKFLITIRGKESICFGEHSFRKRIIDVTIKHADAVITLSNELKDIIQNSVKVNPSFIHTIPNGVDTSLFTLLDKNESRKKLGIPYHIKMILSVGYLIKRKGFHKIIQALPSIVNQHPDTLLYIVGGEGRELSFGNELKRMAYSLSLADRVKFVGSRPNEELVYWYNAADVFCLASDGEGSPNVVMEALACGLPVVASSVGSVPDILDESVWGYCVNPSDIAGFSFKIKKALTANCDRSLIRKYAEQFSWDKCAQQVMGVYQSILNA